MMIAENTATTDHNTTMVNTTAHSARIAHRPSITL